MERGLHLWNERDQAREGKGTGAGDSQWHKVTRKRGKARQDHTPTTAGVARAPDGQPVFGVEAGRGSQGAARGRGPPSSAVLGGPLDPQRRPTNDAGVVGARCARSSGRWKLTWACSVLGTLLCWSATPQLGGTGYPERSRRSRVTKQLGSSCRSGAGPARARRRVPSQIGSTQFQARPIAGKPSSPRWNHGNLSVTATSRKG